jgi:peptide/nickel transport system permease protein
MARFLLRRCLLVVPSLLGLLVVTFLLIHAVPSDPAVSMAGEGADARADRAPAPAVRPRQADLGAVRRLCRQGRDARFRRTRLLAPPGRDRHPAAPAGNARAHLRALFLSICSACRSAWSAPCHNTWPDYLLRVFSVLGIAVAAFWFAIMLQLFFAMDLGWLPLRGDPHLDHGATAAGDRLPRARCPAVGRWDVFVDHLRHLVLPA